MSNFYPVAASAASLLLTFGLPVCGLGPLAEAAAATGVIGYDAAAYSTSANVAGVVPSGPTALASL